MRNAQPEAAANGKGRSPFRKADSHERMLKLFLWGDSGVGKTTIALQFPAPVVVDLERGTVLYGSSFSFDVLHASSVDEVVAAVTWLKTHAHPYHTLVIDPITVFWDTLQRKWSEIFLRRNKGSKGYKFEFYDFQPRDWLTIKAELKHFVRMLLSLEMNVIVTARQKALYAQGSFMKAAGETFDGEKSLPYLFDTVVQLFRNSEGKYLARCLKDRSNKLPRGEFEPTYARFEELFGKANLDRPVQKKTFATDDQKRQLREFITQFNLTPEQVTRRLADYDAGCVDELTEENAEVILSKFQTALAKRSEAQESRKETDDAQN